MSRPLRKIDVDSLRVGMYVSQLDRPWLETPFLFQGFFIRNDNEINELRRYCDFVEIDIEESDPRLVDTLSSTRVLDTHSASSKSARKRPGMIRALLNRLSAGASARYLRRQGWASTTGILSARQTNSSLQEASTPAPLTN